MDARASAIRSQLLILRHRGGDSAALPELVELWERPLLYYLRRLLDSEADAWDALQESWLRAVRDLHRLRDERAFPAWIYTIARNAAFSARRGRRAVEPLPEEGAGDDARTEAPEPALDGWDPMDVHAALARLSLAHRDVLTLHFLEGFSIAEIGAITGTPGGTVKSRLFHAKRAMRALLEGGGS